jgi:hypothetical protein
MSTLAEHMQTHLTSHLDEIRDIDLESWEKTDRPLRFGGPTAPPVVVSDANKPAARSRWLAEHDVQTEFLDAGIGCCWFAQQGDGEPVSGDTEESAIAHLAAERGWKLWDQPIASGQA